MNAKRWAIDVVCLVLIATVLSLRLTPVVSVTPLTYVAIRPEMTVAEVEAVVGGPPRWYDGIRSFGFGVAEPTQHRLSWVSSEGQIAVQTDEHGRVTRADYAPIFVASQDAADLWIERLTRGIGLRMLLAPLALLVAVGVVMVWRRGLFATGSAPLAGASTHAQSVCDSASAAG